MPITLNVIKEKIGRRDLYIIGIVSLLFTILFSTSGSGITVNGVPITDFSALFPVMLTIISAFSGVLAIVLSLSTIPNEYKNKASHLILIRGVSQPRYHGELICGGILSSLIGQIILYIGLALFCILKGEMAAVFKLPIVYLFSAIPTAAISLFAGVTSIKMRLLSAGLLTGLFWAAGFFHTLLLTLINATSSGFLGTVLRRLLKIVPNLYAVQKQGTVFVTGNSRDMDVHVLLGGLLAFYFLTIFVFILKKKEIT